MGVEDFGRMEGSCEAGGPGHIEGLGVSPLTCSEPEVLCSPIIRPLCSR